MLTTIVQQQPMKPTHTTSRTIHIITALLGGIAAYLVALLTFSALLCRMDLSSHVLIPLATIAVCVGALIGGLLLAYAEKKNGLLWGALCGLFFFTAAVLAAFLCGQREIGSLAIIRMVAFVLSGSIGGYLGLMMSERQSHHRIKRE